MAGDALYMLWILAAAFLLGFIVRAAFLCVKKRNRSREIERLEKEDRIIFREKIDDVSVKEELKNSFVEVLSLAAVFSLIIIIGLPLIDFLQNLVDKLKNLIR